MSILDPLMRYGNAVAMEQDALKSSRATPHEARAISRLATKAQALAGEYGEVLTRREALRRARTNLDYVKAMAGQPDIEREASS